MIEGISGSVEEMKKIVDDFSPGKTLLVGGEQGTGKVFIVKEIFSNLEKQDLKNRYRILSLKNKDCKPDKDKIIITSNKEVFNEKKNHFDLNIWLAPLRERLEDIPLFVAKFTENIPENFKFWNRKKYINMLLNYWWPYNISELKRVVTSKEGYKLLPFYHLDEILSDISITELVSRKMNSFWNTTNKDVNPGKIYDFVMNSVEKELIKKALEITNGSKKEASKLLNMHRNTLRLKMNKLNLK